MQPSAEHGEAFDDRAGPDRRAMALGLASLGLMPARPASARRQDAAPDPTAALLPNLVTRMATWIALLIGADILYRFSRVTLDFGRSSLAFGGLRRRVAARA